MVLSGRPEAFEPLVTPYRGPVLALAYRLTRDREDAREVAQEAFLKAFRSLHKSGHPAWWQLKRAGP